MSWPVPGERRGILPDGLRLGTVHLKVADIGRAVDFYERVVGMQARELGGGATGLSAGAEDLLVLHELPGARRFSRRSGLYHVALLFPTREELARVAQRISLANSPIDGASDHGTHEAIYLPDPDGNGLELAWDRSRELWPDLTEMTTIAPQPLDTAGLFNIISGREPLGQAETGLAVGHVHLHVGAIEDSLAFYRDALGFDLVARMPSAAFVSAGGYHHHLAFNVWQGLGAPPAPEDAAGLDHWTIEMPTAEEVAAARERLIRAGAQAQEVEAGFASVDPWGNRLHVVAG